MTVIANKAIAIIPARGGSKRIPGKNIRSFCGLPIIAYSIKAAKATGLFSEVMVSTDDVQIAEIAKAEGAVVPFMRSKENSSDMSSTADVIKEVLSAYGQAGKSFDYCCCIYPTAPFISPERLKQGFQRLEATGADSVFPMVRFSYPVWRGLEQQGEFVRMIWPEHSATRSQDLKPVFHDAGQFYWIRTTSFLKNKELFTSKSVGLEIPESEAQDIDTMEDWKLAELKFKTLKGQD